MSEYPKRSDQEALDEANMLFGPGWLLPIATALVAGGFGYYVAGVSGIFYAETATGCVTGVVLWIKSFLDDERERTHIWVPVERDED